MIKVIIDELTHCLNVDRSQQLGYEGALTGNAANMDLVRHYCDRFGAMPEPIMPSELPKRKLNLAAIAEYMKENNISVSLLTEEEKEKIMKCVKG